ncbi:MAG: hypothetical protein GF416_01845 [Candidatus Altiarchaeales archaeon]|nr:hypothetical protein [Candidatus Altiarchaeales archaeon]MBD3415859.1 hypothetical protein [Candidatus Altiarchaeales archaeon]
MNLKLAIASILFISSIFFFFTLQRGRGVVGEDALADAGNAQVDSLMSLGYVAVVDVAEEDRGKSNVTGYNPLMSFSNLNLYCDQGGDTAYLMDMQGNIVHSITVDYDGCELVEPYNDSILFVMGDKALIDACYDSSVRWVTENRFHHDVAVSETGLIYSLIREDSYHPEIISGKKMQDDLLVVIDPADGTILRRISFAQMIMGDDELLALARKSADEKSEEEGFEGLEVVDVLHTNSLEVIGSDIYSGGERLFKRGDVLFCIRELDSIGVLDMDSEMIVWHWGPGVLEGPHQPSLLENGNILVFDNGDERGYSRLLEMDPLTEEAGWEYVADPPETFFSDIRGGAQRLPNGNTLVTESEKGHVFEIDEEGEVVWDFWNPKLKDQNTRRNSIYRMSRLTSTEADVTSRVWGSPYEALSFCARIAQEKWRVECFGNAQVIFSEFSAAGSVCDATSNSTLADICNRAMLIARTDPLLCYELDERVERAECLAKDAVILEDPTVCYEISREEERGLCLYRIAAKTADPSQCGLIGQKERRDDCLRTIATSTLNASLCIGLDGVRDLDTCYGTIAVELNESRSCARIPTEFKRDRCYKEVAKNLNDLAICSAIVSDSVRESCQSIICKRDDNTSPEC